VGVKTARNRKAIIFVFKFILSTFYHEITTRSTVLSTCDCGELVATCQLSEGYGVLTYIVCVAIAAVLWGALAQDECDEDDPPETMYN